MSIPAILFIFYFITLAPIYIKNRCYILFVVAARVITIATTIIISTNVTPLLAFTYNKFIPLYIKCQEKSAPKIGAETLSDFS